MFKILVPVDFSPESEKAFRFALKVAAKLNGVEIILLHAIMINGITPRLVREMEDILVQETTKEFDELIKNANYQPGHEIKFKKLVTFDGPVNSILENSKKHKTDLIVIGSRGAGKTGKLLFGSNSIEVLEHSSCPVLVIPANAEIHEVNHIVYASDLVNFRIETKTMAALAKLLDATLHIIHIYPESLGPQMFDENKILEDLRMESQYDKITFMASMNTSVISGIKNYTKTTKPDIIALYTKHRSFFEELFDSSFTKELVLDTKTPLLAVPQRNKDQ